MRRLLVMRHAKAEPASDHRADHERPLDDRGARSARLVGRMLTEQGLAPGHVISSTAVRARSTAELAAEAGRWTAPIRLESGFYDSGVEEVVTIAAGAPDVDRLMLVGHQPTWAMLVAELTGDLPQMKTASVAVVDLHLESWADLSSASGDLAAVHHPSDRLGSPRDGRP